MNTQPELTTAYWDKQDHDLRSMLHELNLSMEQLRRERGDLLLLLPISDDKTAKEKLHAIERDLKDKELQIESINAKLTALPKHRNYAKANEVEEDINSVRGLMQQLSREAQNIDQAAEQFVLAIKRYYDLLRGLFEISPEYFDFRLVNIGALDSLGVFLRKHDLWKFIKVGMFAGAQSMAETFEKNSTSRAARLLLHLMQDNVIRLRGETAEGKRQYCKECYGTLIFLTPASTKRQCKLCGTPEDE